MLLPGDKVRYTGRKFNLSNKIGEVVKKVGGSDTTYVVDFFDNGSGYIMGENVLERFRPPKDYKEPEIRRSKYDTDDE